MEKTSPRLEKAIAVATKAHEGQLRKTGEPYIIHPLAVMKILQEWNMDEDTVIAGVLHDTVEDTDLTLKEIEDESVVFYDWVVAVLVEAMAEDLVKFFATFGLECADFVGGNFIDSSFIILSWKIELIENLAIFHKFDNLAVGPGRNINTVSDGFKFNLITREIVIISNTSM